MKKDTRRSLATLSGAGLCLLGLAATLTYPAAPEFVDEPAKIAAFYGDNSETVLTANAMYLLGGTLMIVFAGALRSILAEAEGNDGLLSGLAFGGMLAGAAVTLAGTALDTAGALRVDEQGSIAPDTAAVLADGHNVMFGMAAPMGFGVAVLATAAIASRTSILPTWLTGLSTGLGIALLVPPISHVAAVAFTFWCLVTSLVLFVQSRTDEAATSGKTAQPDELHIAHQRITHQPKEHIMGRTATNVTMVVISAFVVAALAAASAGAAGQDLRSPDARDAALSSQAGSYQDLRSPDARDAARPEALTSPAVDQAAGSPGRDWSDVGFVAGGLLTVVLALGALSVLIRRRRTVRRSRVIVSG